MEKDRDSSRHTIDHLLPSGRILDTGLAASLVCDSDRVANLFLLIMLRIVAILSAQN
jgi:hypothetical protein